MNKEVCVEVRIGQELFALDLFVGWSEYNSEITHSISVRNGSYFGVDMDKDEFYPENIHDAVVYVDFGSGIALIPWEDLDKHIKTLTETGDICIPGMIESVTNGTYSRVRLLENQRLSFGHLEVCHTIDLKLLGHALKVLKETVKEEWKV